MANARLSLALALLLVGCQGRAAPDGTDPSGQVRPPNHAPAGETGGDLAQERHPTLADFWDGRAGFQLDVIDTGLPMGESDTVIGAEGTFHSFMHASFESAGTVDSCGDPVPFPGCVVSLASMDGGATFAPEGPPTCLIACSQCPCDSAVDHIDQQQYPRLQQTSQGWFMVYEYRGRVMLRRSVDGSTWEAPKRIGGSGPRDQWPWRCPAEERIGDHPHVDEPYDCLAGGPPGIHVEGDQIYVFLALGQNPSSMGCFVGMLESEGDAYRRCTHNPLFTGAAEYGPADAQGPDANPYFDFRFTSAAEVVKVGEGAESRYYMLYEGIRGPGPGDPGDSQFGLGLARSLTDEIDGQWEKFPGNPILADLPGNIGLGHADVVLHRGRTLLYTSLDGVQRSRFVLAWRTGLSGMPETD